MEDIKALGFIWTFREEHCFLDGELSSAAAAPFLAVAAHRDDCSYLQLNLTDVPGGTLKKKKKKRRYIFGSQSNKDAPLEEDGGKKPFITQSLLFQSLQTH